MKSLTVLALLLSACSLRAQHGADAARASLAGLQLADGLKVDLFAADPLLFNPVAMSIDEQGRFFLAESHRWKDSIFDLWTKDEHWKLADFSFTEVAQREAFLRQEFATTLARLTKDSEVIRLLQDTNGDGIADSSTVFAAEFNGITSGTAAGVLAENGELWFTCIPDLWHFTYDSQGRPTAKEVLQTGYGVRTSVSGHDLHGLVRGPDGRLYFSVGDRGANVRTKEGGQLENYNCGAVFRCEPDGSRLELFATGLRNPQDLAFDLFGNLWTHDNDTSGDDPPRVLHVIEGADYGWRQSYQFMPEFGPWVLEKVWDGHLDNVLPPAGIGAQGPAGLAAYPGIGLPRKYDGALLGCDFPMGVWAYFFTPRGPSYELRKEHLLWGLGPTDLDFGPDCHLYVADWGRSYEMPNGGRILRISLTGSTNALPDLRPLLGGGLKAVRSEELVGFLAHADRRVRTAAQFELERRHALEFLALAARSETNQFARVHAIWGLGNLARHGDALVAGLLPALARDADPEIRAQAVRQMAELLASPSGPKIISSLLDALGDSSPRVQLHALLSLAHAPKSDDQISPALLRFGARPEANDPFFRHAIVQALVRREDLNAIQAAAGSDNANLRRIAAHGWRRLNSPAIASLLTDPDLAVRQDAARAINDCAIAAAFPALAERLESSESAPQILLRSINANFRLGDATAWARLLRQISRAGLPVELRAEALHALAEWPQPGPLDRVVGLWRPLDSQRAVPDRPALSTAILPLLHSQATHLVLAALACIEKNQLLSTDAQLLTDLENESLPESIRQRILNVLGHIHSPQLPRAVDFALHGARQSLRAEAVSWLPSVAPDHALPLIQTILAAEQNLPLRQSAFAALGKLDSPPANALINQWIDKLDAGQCPPDLQLDVIEAALPNASAGSRAKLTRFITAGAPSDSLSGFRWALQGGNDAAGQQIFREKDAVGCIRCHSIRGTGGAVGPDLAGIASKHDRPYLLESIIHPNAQLAPGFESVSLALKDGRSLAGTVRNETGEELTINSPEDGLVIVKKPDIANRTKTLSPMPEGLADLLSRRELRDLIEYLASLK